MRAEPELPTVADLQRICQDRGMRLTEQRRETFKALRAVRRPLSAYELLPRLEKRLGKRLAPLTVYRALDFLLAQGLVHKIASNHTYALCNQPHTHHESVQLVCNDCGRNEELALGTLGAELDQLAAECGFAPARHIVELEGRCQNCTQG